VEHYNQFVHDSVTSRIALQKEQSEKPESDRRQDLFYFLFEAKDPDTGLPAYNEDELRAEASLLIVAGSDTTSVSLSGIFFYLTGDLRRCQKLTDEILTTFEKAEDIVYGPKLLGCTYLRACIDEGIRLTPPGPCDLPREVLPGGIQIDGQYIPPGTVVGTVPWVNSRNEEIWGDAGVFRPERWIIDEPNGVTAESLAPLRANFHPFLTGPGSCVGKNVAMTEIMITVARTLHRLEFRRAPGSTFGGGASELGWGARDKCQFQLEDAYISLRQGPEVQFRKRSR
jgi:cytochrome P450